MSLKVYDLLCDNGHSFEGWFGGHSDYLAQQHSGLLECPLCASKTIHKTLSAPHLNLSQNKNPETQAPATTQASDHHSEKTSAAQTPNTAPATLKQQNPAHLAGHANLSAEQAHWLSALRRMVNESEDLGQNFAQEALNMHRGDTQARPIRGQANPDELKELLEEGVPVLPIPSILKEPLQ